MTRAGNSAFQQSLFLFPFKKVSDFIACGKNQRNKLKEAQHVFGADQKHRTFELSWEKREQVYPAFTMCQIQAWGFLPFSGRLSQKQVKFHTTGHQDRRRQNYWTPESNTTRDQCEKHPFNQELKQDTVYSSINILRMVGSSASPTIITVSMNAQCSLYKMSQYLYIVYAYPPI